MTFLTNLRRRIVSRWIRLLWGDITFQVRDTIAYVSCEIEYFDCRGDSIGYWAYGYFDPAYPYAADDTKISQLIKESFGYFIYFVYHKKTHKSN